MELDLKQIEEDIKISDDLNVDLIKQSQLRLFYAIELSKKQAKLAEAKTTLSTTRSRTAKNARNSGTKWTENSLKEFVDCDYDVLRVTKIAIEAETARDEIKAVVDALDMKRDMLVQLCKRQREEVDIILKKNNS